MPETQNPRKDVKATEVNMNICWVWSVDVDRVLTMALAGLELKTETRLVSNSNLPSFSLHSARIKGMYHLTSYV